MAARLTSTGIQFSDNTTLTTKFGIIPQNTATIFYQTAAPPRWTKSTANNDKILRVVSGDAGDGGGSGGTSPFSTVFPTSFRPITGTFPVSGGVGNHTLALSQIASHGHNNGGSVGLSPGGGDVSAAAGWSRSAPGVGNNGGGGAHSHSWAGNAVFSQSLDLRVQYIDVISCTFNG
jgi:hypothetical protein